MKKIPREVKKALKTMAEELPAMYYNDIKVSLAMRAPKSAFDEKNGKLVVEKLNDRAKMKTYIASDTEAKHIVNHFRKLTQQWEKSKTEAEAWQRINTYIAQVKHKANQENQ